MEQKELHEGIITINIECVDDTSHNGTGDYLDPEFVEKLGLKPGDCVQYTIEDDEINIIGKVHITRTIEKIN